MTRETELFKRIYQKHIIGQADKHRIVFSIGTDKDKSQVEFHPDIHTLEYHNMTKTAVVLEGWFLILLYWENWLLKR